MPENNAAIRVMLVDDHDMVRQGLMVFIETVSDMELVGQAPNGQLAVEMAEQVNPDVILMDLIMPEMDGIQTTRRIKAVCPNAQVIALTSFKEKELVQAVLEAGAIGYILKNTSIDELAKAIRTAYEGNPVLAPEATQALIDVATQPNAQRYNLTEREREILVLMTEGLNNPQIGERLSLSRFTVKAYVSDILSKLGVTSRSEAVALAVQHKLVETAAYPPGG